MKNKKTILIDTVSLLSSFTGIGRYTYENALRLQKLDTQNYDWFYNYASHHSKNLYLQKQSKKDIALFKKIKSTVLKIPILKKSIRKLIFLYSKFSPTTYDLYWQPSFIPDPNIKAKKLICTVHDFSFYLQPKWHPKERLEYFEKYFYTNVKKADHIITGSHFSKDEIVKYLNYDPKNITVIHHGVDHNIYKLYTQDILTPTKKKFNLPDSFILFVGSIEPRKNLVTLLKAYTKLPQEYKENNPLILVGFQGWQNKEIISIINKEKKYIKYLGYVENEELAHIYNLATIFVYPTHYEGFGIPPIEAFACATPTIVSDVSSLPEVCTDCSLYIDPNNENDLKDKLKLLLDDKDLQQELIQKGLLKVKQYSWEKAAKEHLDVFEKVLKSERGE